MRQSQLFTRTKKDLPKDEVSASAQKLLQAGFIHKEMAGVYSYLPLGLRVLVKICQIIREEMNQIGGQEIELSALQDPEIWQKTKRWPDETVDIWFKTRLKNNTEVGLGFTHEEPITRLMTSYVQSYRDLPRLIYQIQTKFRNEARAKSGIMRCREFLMKDLYSFARTEAEHGEQYEKVKNAYTKIWQRVGIGDSTYLTFASGGVFAKYSHEFQTVSEAGEDRIYLDREKGIAINKEVLTDAVMNDLGVTKKNLVERRAIEVGNIFSLGTRFSESLGLVYTAEDGARQPVIMGSYGIGPGRLLGTIVELRHDQRGIIWPASVAPFAVHLISLCQEEADEKQAEKIYETLQQENIEVLYDDRPDVRAGEKFADSDLIGIPIRAVVSPKTLAKGMVEVKERNSDKVSMVSMSELVPWISNRLNPKP